MRITIIAGGLFLFFLGGVEFRADDAKPAKPEPASRIDLKVPETVADLRALEKQVQAVVAKVRPATVGVSIGPAQGSGVFVKDGYVLTAGHVSGQPGRNAIIHLPDGRKLKGKTLGRNGDIDSGLIKVMDAGKWPAVEMGKSADLKKGQWVVTIGHPGGFRPNRTPVVRLGRILVASPVVIATDCTLVGGDSGGPLFDLEGRVIGIHSRIGGGITQNFHVPVDTYSATWDRLAKGESWGGGGGGQLVQSPGGKVVFEKKERLTPKDPRDKIFKTSHHKVFTFKMDPEAIFTIDLASKQFDSFLRIEDSMGKEVARDDDGAGNLNARIAFRPPREDEYRIIATSFKGGQTGPFTLMIRRLEAKELMVQGKVDVFAALKMPRFMTPLLLRQLAGQVRAPLFLSGTIIDAAGKPATNKEIHFEWDNGKETLKTNDQGIVRLPLSMKKVKDLALHVPRDHRALLELTDAGGRLHFFKFSHGPGKEKAPIPPGTVVLQAEGTITAADPLDKARAGCRHKVHALRVKAGGSYTIDLESTDFDAFLRVETADARQLAEDDDSGGEFNSRLVLRPEKDEDLRIIVTTCDPGQFGAYRLTVRRAEKK